MTAPSTRRWYRGTAVRCSCSGTGSSGTVVSQRPVGALPRVRIGEVEHDCETAVLIDRRAARVSSARKLSSWAPRVRLDSLTRSWLRAVPASQRAAVVAAALAEAARRGPVARAVAALHDEIAIAVEQGSDLRDLDLIPPAVTSGDDDWDYQFECAFRAAASAWRREAHDDDIVAAAVEAALAAAVKCGG